MENCISIQPEHTKTCLSPCLAEGFDIYINDMTDNMSGPRVSDWFTIAPDVPPRRSNEGSNNKCQPLEDTPTLIARWWY